MMLNYASFLALGCQPLSFCMLDPTQLCEVSRFIREFGFLGVANLAIVFKHIIVCVLVVCTPRRACV